MPVTFSWVELHGALTHFPIAFLLASVACDAAATLPWSPSWWPRGGAQLRQIGLWSLAASVVTAVPALLTGYFTSRGLRHPPTGLPLHWEAALATSIIATLLLAWRLLIRDRPNVWSRATGLALGLAGAAAVSLTGYLGGQMVLGGGSAVGGGVGGANLAAGPQVGGPETADPRTAANTTSLAAANLDLAAERLDLATDKLAFTLQPYTAQATGGSPSLKTRSQAAPQLRASVANGDLIAVNQKLTHITDQLTTITDRLPISLNRPQSTPIAAFPASPTPQRVASSRPSKAGSSSATISRKTASPPAATLNDEGSKLFHGDDQSCISCHRVGDEGGAIGPDLTHEVMRGHDAAWQRDHLKEPTSLVPGSRMPPYSTLRPHDLDAIVAYLGSLK